MLIDARQTVKNRNRLFHPSDDLQHDGGNSARGPDLRRRETMTNKTEADYGCWLIRGCYGIFRNQSIKQGSTQVNDCFGLSEQLSHKLAVRKGDYTATWRRLRRLQGIDSKILGSIRFWMSDLACLTRPPCASLTRRCNQERTDLDCIQRP